MRDLANGWIAVVRLAGLFEADGTLRTEIACHRADSGEERGKPDWHIEEPLRVRQSLRVEARIAGEMRAEALSHV